MGGPQLGVGGAEVLQWPSSLVVALSSLLLFLLPKTCGPVATNCTHKNLQIYVP